MYSIVRVRDGGVVTSLQLYDKKDALSAYLTALNFNVENNAFIALFDNAVMIKNNQERGKKK